MLPIFGRPSIDPVTFFKLQLIMFFEGIRSERQLMEQVQVNLAYRWYLGYDLDETVPDHSSLSKIRTRYGLEVFQLFFEKIVERCIEEGLVWGKELYFDGTKVRANAATTSLAPRWIEQARQQLRVLFKQEVNATALQEPISRTFVPIYDGTRMTGRRERTYQRTTQPPDMNRHGSVITIVIPAPHTIQQLFTGENLLWMRCQHP